LKKGEFMSLLEKYAVPGPRYTSYPTVPYWNAEVPTTGNWLNAVEENVSKDGAEVSLYIHLPYCEKMCTFCGCNTRITRRHEVEKPYIQTILKEWRAYREVFPADVKIAEIHLGGGTPTFFSPENLKSLIDGILKYVPRSDESEFSFEANPNTTEKAHLDVLFDLGFRRISFGIQDFDPRVQSLIHRVQPFDRVAKVVAEAREIGYDSVNFDLIYGLPAQSLQTISDTIQKTALLRPDRLAYYSYAHIPWIKPAQRMYEDLLPSAGDKFQFYEQGKRRLEELGYVDIGMDHFSLPSDSLYRAAEKGILHRNFMGYTTTSTKVQIGLGASAISDAWTYFVQNEKKVEDYMEAIKKGNLSLYRGHALNTEDLYIRKHILNLMCRFQTHFAGKDYANFWSSAKDRLAPMEADGLVTLLDQAILVRPSGRPFIRNVCMALDARMWRKKPDSQLFSSTV
jgi:oxygen-independent coproporphyrinogen-3 oxidase